MSQQPDAQEDAPLLGGVAEKEEVEKDSSRTNEPDAADVAADVVYVSVLKNHRIVDLVNSQETAQRVDLYRILISMFVFGAFAGAILYLPNQETMLANGFLFPIAGILIITSFLGTTLNKSITVSKMIFQVLFVSWVVLLIGNAIENEVARRAYSYIALIVVVTIYSFFLPPGERNLSFGLTPIFFATLTNDALATTIYIWSSIMFLFAGSLLGVVVTSCTSFLPLGSSSSSVRVHRATARCALLIDEACLRLFVALPLSVQNKEQTIRRPYFAKYLGTPMRQQSWSYEHSLAKVSSLLGAAEKTVEELNALQLAGTCFEPWADQRKSALAQASAAHLRTLIAVSQKCLLHVRGARYFDLMSMIQHKQREHANSDVNSQDESELEDMSTTIARVCITANIHLRALVTAMDVQDLACHDKIEEVVPDIVPPDSLTEAQALFRALSEERMQNSDQRNEQGESDGWAIRRPFARFSAEFAVFSMALANVAFQLKDTLSKPPASGRWAHMKKVLGAQMLPARFYEQRANGSLSREIALASRVVLAIAIASLWEVVPYLSAGQSSNPGFKILIGEVPMTVGLVWVDLAGGAFSKCIDRAVGVLVGVLASLIYWMYIPAFPYTVVPYWALAFPIFFLSGRYGTHAYVMVAAFASFVITFAASVGHATQLDINLNNKDARDVAINICLSRVATTSYGIAIALFVLVFYFPQTSAQEFYRSVKRTFSVVSENIAHEAERTHEDYDAHADADWMGSREGFALFGAIGTLKANGDLAVAEFSWLKTTFPAQLPGDLHRSFLNIMLGIASIRQARLATTQMAVLTRSATVIAGRALLLESTPKLLAFLANACNDAAEAYFAKNRVDIDFNAYVPKLDHVLAQYKAIEDCYASDSAQHGQYTAQQRAALKRYMSAHQNLHLAILDTSRSLCVFKGIYSVGDP